MTKKNTGRRPPTAPIAPIAPPAGEPGSLAELIAQKQQEIETVKAQGQQSLKGLWQQHDEARQAAAHYKQQAIQAQGEINGILNEKQTVLKQLQDLEAKLALHAPAQPPQPATADDAPAPVPQLEAPGVGEGLVPEVPVLNGVAAG